jgi:hypothetical protein
MSEVKQYADGVRTGVIIATEKLNVTRAGKPTVVLPGELVPEAVGWERALVEMTNARRLVRLSPDACVAIVREAIKADPTLLDRPRRDRDPQK